MKINNRISIILCVVLCAFLIALAIISHLFILTTFTDIERKQETADMQRLLSQLNGEVEDVAAVCSEWAQWDDTYAFVKDLNPVYVHANLAQPTLFRNMKINYVLFYNSSGDLVYSRGYNSDDGTMIDVPLELDTIIRNSIVPWGVSESVSGRRGYAMLNGEPVILAGFHITPSDQQGLSRGTVVMVRRLDAGQINDIAQQTDLDITIRQVSKDTDNGLITESELKRMETGEILGKAGE